MNTDIDDSCSSAQDFLSQVLEGNEGDEIRSTLPDKPEILVNELNSNAPSVLDIPNTTNIPQRVKNGL